MSQPNRNRSITIALYVNAALLAGICALILFRGNGAAAMAAQPPMPIAGGGSIYLMPAQFSSNTWGCYIMDIDNQTLCAYQYLPGDKSLHFISARDFHWDRKLTNYNTEPRPDAIQRLVETQMKAMQNRGGQAPPTTQSDDQ